MSIPDISGNGKLLLYSGGLDSTVLLYEERPAMALFFQYGQHHSKEIFYAQDHCRATGTPFLEKQLPVLLGSSLTTPTEGHGTCVVPFRNLIFLAVAANLAEGMGHKEILIGCNADDEAMFPDCRRGFMELARGAIEGSMQCLLGGSEWIKTPEIRYPLIGKTKREIASRAKRLGINRESIWSCYAGQEEPCGECEACKVSEGIWE